MSRRRRWQPLVVLTTVVVVGIVATCLLICKVQERRDFVGRVDTLSGYRCRFTLSSAWRQYDGPSQDDLGILSQEDSFCPPPPNPITAWIAVHLLHKVLPPETPTIALMMVRPNSTMFHVRDGYPELAGANPPSPDISQRHLRIDGCLATVVTQTNSDYRAMWLIVSVPNVPVIYAVTAYDVPSDIAQSDHEMQAIMSSFHVERVAAPTVGRQ